MNILLQIDLVHVYLIVEPTHWRHWVHERELLEPIHVIIRKFRDFFAFVFRIVNEMA